MAAERLDIGGPLREFLESMPLYSPVKFDGYASQVRDWPKKLTLWCPVDKGERPFKMAPVSERKLTTGTFDKGLDTLDFVCTDCEKENVIYYVLVEGREGDEPWFSVRKVGQYPAMMIEPSKGMKAFLGDEGGEAFFKRGLTCLAQGYGLGALVYFRRVVEDSARGLVMLLAELAEVEEGPEGKKEAAGLKRTAQGKDTEAILGKAKALLPEHMRVRGENPLQAAYDIASVDLHRRTEEEALADSISVRATLEYTVLHLQAEIQAKREYLREMSKIGALLKEEGGRGGGQPS